MTFWRTKLAICEYNNAKVVNATAFLGDFIDISAIIAYRTNN